MEISPRPPRRRATVELWRIAVLVVGALCFALLALGRVPSRDTHEAILTSLRAIDVNHASLQRDVLQARAGLLRSYDPLVRSISDLRATVNRLRSVFPESGVENIPALTMELNALSGSIDRDEELVERFRKDNTLLQTSLTAANQLLTELHESNDPAIKEAVGRSVDLGNLMMRFTTEPNERLARAIQDKLGAMLRSDKAVDPSIVSYVAQARTILTALPAVDDTIQAIQASKTSYEAQILQKQYLDAYGLISVRSSWSRTLLGSISVFLCIYIGILVYRLRAQTHRLTQQLDLETLTADIRRRFGDDTDDVSAPLVDCLSIVADFFDASRYSFFIVDSRTKMIMSSYGETDQSALAPLLQRHSEQISTATMKEQLHWDRFYYHNLQQSEILAFPEGAMSAGSVVAASIDADSVALMFLEHKDLRSKPGGDEIRLLGHAIITLAQCIKGQRERRERRQLEARLEHSQRLEALGTLAGGIAHEFNNTLGAIMGYGEMALHLNNRTSRTRQYLQEIVSSGHRAKHIIDQILTFSRKRERVSRPFDLKEAIDDIVPLVQMSIPAGISVTAAIADEMPAIVGNPLELQQAIMNLCMNAAQASGEEGRIRLTAERIEIAGDTPLSHDVLPRGRYIMIDVTDNGSGIAPGLLRHVFEPFFTTKSKSGGTGLGLAAVHGYVTGMNGRIHVESTPATGTTFKLYFPFTAENPVPLAQFFDERTVPLGDGQVVALAQRDQSLRLMFEEKIAALGYEPVGFSNLAALRKWIADGERHPDLIVFDLDIWQSPPDLEAVAQEYPFGSTLFLTDPARDGLDPRRFPSVPTLRKPVSANSLATTLSRLIETKMVAIDSRSEG
ncbi:hypothetical protein ASE04_11235 [Rhizobium sp. Root708]|uniref:two-component system VirA-like sensor kinase n=1 Tax=Rhizobium sp. Root708 TaxID=1736592 RepID=UPI0006F42E90|nr:two-component system VirA-like sensor kinase [Rhizobium sp. Root708]KRB51346.1 hypothetical protein ASE04_11235 [Rhizobium sp. Root708]